ncbi:MAG: hypothetical protein OHK0039_16410 [Bacteroidia bacterium]
MLFACQQPPVTRVQRSGQTLLFYQSPGQASADLARQAAEEVATRQGFAFVASQDPALLDEDSLMRYSVVVIHGLQGDSCDIRQQSDLQRYVQAGNGLVLIDARLSQPYTFPWLEHLLRPQTIAQPGEAITRVRDEQTFFTLRDYDGGRVAWTTPGTDIWRTSGLEDALGQAFGFARGDNSYDPARITAPRAPKDNRFTHIVLDDYDVNEPMELAVTPTGKVIYIERRGRMKMYDPETESVRLLATFDVCTEGNYEDGLLGLTLDPNFARNGYLYLYYSPGADCQRPQTLSRFRMYQDSLIIGSEKVILEVPVQRETCCHSGGSIAFGPDGCLYLSTGDNTSSKESDGYTPIDERPGRGPFDAQKSSGNRADLRGKILRIRPTDFATYEIPAGNLFPRDGSQGRPEIYVMGCRNPFRFSIDARRGWLYWGDVGPDVGYDGRYGPQSYDEWNQARQPGNYGWPYFVGNNFAYRQRDFATDTLGAFFDPAHPVNSSPNNYGPRDLPPARPAFIWYPYGRSAEFPMLGTGSRSAMAGPVYYRDAYPAQSQVRFPDYYDGKLFIYEWARSWIKVVTLDSAGNLVKIEDFLPDLTLTKPIDIEFGPDGAMYMLEYGQNYFMNNPEARLVKIEYAEGNRLPKPIVQVDKPDGAAPHTASFCAAGSFDYDEADSVLRYLWSFTDPQAVQAEGETATFTFTENGTYQALLRVVDPAGDTAEATIQVRVGNAPPTIDIVADINEDFFFPGQRIDYRVAISDPEDGVADVSRSQVSWVYVPDGHDLQVLLGEGGGLPEGSILHLDGLTRINNSDCRSCHALREHSVGPSYYEISRRYLGDAGAERYLARKIISGGNGVWGEKIMASHPQHSEDETAAMARYILSLAESDRNRRLPLQGTVQTAATALPGSVYLLSATYTDAGGGAIAPLSTRVLRYLSYPRIEAESYDHARGASQGRMGAARDIGVAYMGGDTAWLCLGAKDLTQVAAMQVRYQSRSGGRIELRAGSPDGTLLGQAALGTRTDWTVQRMALTPQTGRQTLYLVLRGQQGGAAIDYLDLERARTQ